MLQKNFMELEKIFFKKDIIGVTMAELTGTDGSDRIVGTQANDTIWAGRNNDTVQGLGGNDRLFGGPGHDVIYGGDGNDRIEGGIGYDHLFGGAGDDTILGNESPDMLMGGAGDDHLLGGQGDDQLRGNAGADILRGNEGDDRLDGGDGNDILYGSTGADRLIGGFGNDVYRLGIGQGIETIVEIGGTDHIEFDAGIYFQDLGFQAVGDDLVISHRAMNGTTLTVEIANQMQGGRIEELRFDTVSSPYVWNGKAFIKSDAPPQPIPPPISPPPPPPPAGGATEGADQIVGSPKDDHLSGLGGDDHMAGGAGNDVLRGGPGNDTLRGEAGNDTLDGGPGDDLLYGGLGVDSFIGGAGRDTVSFVDERNGVHVDLNQDGSFAAAVDSDGNWYGPTEEMSGIERVRGSDYDDSMGLMNWDGNSTAGSISLFGLGGDDYLRGGQHDDEIEGNDGDDELLGWYGNDRIQGNAGDDFIEGGGGDDIIRGGPGNDIFAHYIVILEGYDYQGHDTIQDFTSGEDLLSLGAIVAYYTPAEETGADLNSKMIFDLLDTNNDRQISGLDANVEVISIGGKNSLRLDFEPILRQSVDKNHMYYSDIVGNTLTLLNVTKLDASDLY